MTAFRSDRRPPVPPPHRAAGPAEDPVALREALREVFDALGGDPSALPAPLLAEPAAGAALRG